MAKDGNPFEGERDRVRLLHAGKPLMEGLRGALVEFRADLQEHVYGLGLPSYLSKVNSCFECHVNKVHRADLERFGQGRKRTHEELTQSASEQLRKVRLASARLGELAACLGFRKGAGRAVVRASPLTRSLRLRVGDVLVVGGDISDTHVDLTSLRGEHISMEFFRREAGVLGLVSAFLDIPGFRIPDMCMLDVLHTVDLGVGARLVGVALMELLHCGLWGPITEKSPAIAMRNLRADLKEYYKRSPDRKRRSEIGRGFSYKMLGKRQRPFFKGKGSESRHLLGFVRGLLDLHSHRLARGSHLLKATKHLQGFHAVCKHAPRVLSPADSVKLVKCAENFIKAWVAFGGHTTMKHHFLLHLAHKAGEFGGNPRFHTTYRDEGYNRFVKRIAQTCHSRVFAARVLTKHDRAVGPKL